MPETLYEQMARMVRDIERLHKEGIEHHDICTKIADTWELWYDDSFPVWLSRIVEGVQRDG